MMLTFLKTSKGLERRNVVIDRRRTSLRLEPLMWAALHDLAIRACPVGLQGTLMMVISGVNVLGVRAGDLIGGVIYSEGGRFGFVVCVALTSVVYAFLALLLVVRPLPIPLQPDGEPDRPACRQPRHGGQHGKAHPAI